MVEDSKTLESLSFEQALAELEKIVARLEGGDLGLEEAIKAYERGAELKQLCEKKLNEAKLRVDKIMLSGTSSATGESKSGS